MRGNFTYLLVIILIFINFSSIINEQPVVNSCGKVKTEQREPNDKSDCEDADEPACKLVIVYKKIEVTDRDTDSDKKFCAVIHGKANDKSVLDSVAKLIGRKVEIEGNGKSIKFKLLLIIGLLFGLI